MYHPGKRPELSIIRIYDETWVLPRSKFWNLPWPSVSWQSSSFFESIDGKSPDKGNWIIFTWQGWNTVPGGTKWVHDFPDLDVKLISTLARVPLPWKHPVWIKTVKFVYAPFGNDAFNDVNPLDEIADVLEDRRPNCSSHHAIPIHECNIVVLWWAMSQLLIL